MPVEAHITGFTLSDPVIIAMLAAVTSAIGGAVAVVLAIINRRGIQALHIDVNHRLDQLVTARETLARSEGIAEGLSQSAPPPNPHQLKEPYG